MTYDAEPKPGNFLQRGKRDFYKIMDMVDDTTARAKPVDMETREAGGREITININNCKNCISRRQLGQITRFKDRGTGFSRQGRKLKYNRSRHLEQIRYIREHLNQ